MLVNGEKNNVKRTLTNIQRKERSLNVSNYNKARYLVDKFLGVGKCEDAGKCYNYFVKIFCSLPENLVWELYENSVNNPKVKTPIKYFIASCRNHMNG